jgi:spore germination protein GerM
VLAALVSVAAAGCSIQPDTAPRVIPPNDRVELNPLLAEGGEAAGTTRLYLVAASDGGERELRAVARDVDATPTAALQELLKGPNPPEVDGGLGTELPPGLSLLSARQAGSVLQVDVSEEILDLPAPGTILAVAQIVFTASQIDGVEQVRLRVNGNPRAWPDGRGELTTAPLTTYDYPDLVESTQPAYPPIPSGQRAG